jgi:glycosyltransferase involved in cell wall biosynthesis
MISTEDERKLKSLNTNIKTAVVPAGVMSNLLTLQKGEVECGSIGFLGSLDWFPNLDGISWFIKSVMPKLVEKRPDIKLYLYGGGVPNDFYIPHSLENNIFIKGFVDEIWSEILSKELVVVPLRIGGGIRVKILELLAAGQNVITSAIGAEGIPVENEKHLLIANSAMEFVNKIDQFLSNRFDNSAMIKNGKELIASNYTWEIIAEKFERLYSSLIK